MPPSGLARLAYETHGTVGLVTWRVINISLAVLAGVVCAIGPATGDLWRAAPAAGCAVLFGLEAAGVVTWGRTARLLRERRTKCDE